MVDRIEGGTKINEKQDGSLFFVHCCFGGTCNIQQRSFCRMVFPIRWLKALNHLLIVDMRVLHDSLDLSVYYNTIFLCDPNPANTVEPCWRESPHHIFPTFRALSLLFPIYEHDHFFEHDITRNLTKTEPISLLFDIPRRCTQWTNTDTSAASECNPPCVVRSTRIIKHLIIETSLTIKDIETWTMGQSKMAAIIFF